MPKMGFYTPSRFADAMKNNRKKDGPGQGAIDLAYEVAMERMGVYAPDISAPSLTWGNDHEPMAIKRYMDDTFAEVEPVLDTLFHPEVPYVAGMPDGFVGTEGLIEVKCPYNPKNHLLNLADGRQIDQYTPQMQGYMWITQVEWCDFVSFDPRYSEEHQIKIIRVFKDDAYISLLAERLELLNNLTEEIVTKIKKL